MLSEKDGTFFAAIALDFPTAQGQSQNGHKTKPALSLNTPDREVKLLLQSDAGLREYRNRDRATGLTQLNSLTLEPIQTGVNEAELTLILLTE